MLPLPLPLLLLLLLALRSGSALLPGATADSQPCRLLSTGGVAGATVVCSSNVTIVDLSGRGLSGQLTLTFASSNSSNHSRQNGRQQNQQQHIALLNVSDNPRLTGVTIDAAVGASGHLVSVHINRLDISGTAMAPVPGRLLNATSTHLLSVRALIANGTTYTEPLDLGQAADLLYRLRVLTFALIGWPIANGRLPVNLTSHGANRCGSKGFKSLTVSRSQLLRVLHGGSDGRASMNVTDAIDLSGNGLRSVSNVTFSAGRVDLSDNQLADLPGVSFWPGSSCRTAVTGPPTLLLRRNRLAYAALDSLATTAGGFTGLDLSGNEGLLPPDEATAMTAAGKATIVVAEFLDLSGLGGYAGSIAHLLTRFRLTATTAFRLSLANNWIPDLASAAALVADLAGRGNATAAVPVHLDLSGNPPLVHLNLSEMPPHLLASLTVRRLPRLRSASVRVRHDANGAGVLERLRRSGLRPDAGVLAELWSRQVPLRLDARPDHCCLSDDSELICTFGSGVQHAGSGGVFCYSDHDDEAQRGPSQPPPELPLLFTCVVLGCALLLGLLTGVAVFYARRRSRGRYAVYSIYAVHVKNHHQQQHPQHPLHPQQQQHPQQQYPQSPNCRVQLKAVTVSSVVPVEKAATPV